MITYPTIISQLAESTTEVGSFYGSSLGSLTQIGAFESPTSISSTGYIGIIMLSHNVAGTSSGTLSYMLSRNYPPNNVMPSAAFGSVS